MRRNRIPIEAPNGNLLVPSAFDAEGITGDGPRILVEITPQAAAELHNVQGDPESRLAARV
jgi:hypothetical protein